MINSYSRGERGATATDAATRDNRRGAAGSDGDDVGGGRNFATALSAGPRNFRVDRVFACLLLLQLYYTL